MNEAGIQIGALHTLKYYSIFIYSVLHFSTVKGSDDTGKAIIHFRNISGKPLNFKLKCEQGSNIAVKHIGFCVAFVIPLYYVTISP
uniref:Reelin domain-containing protein n=1 Tax=Parascaris univalens TaxID=6257 RepID=A0A915BKX7_PARUN